MCKRFTILFIILGIASSNIKGQPIENSDSILSVLSQTKDPGKRTNLFIQLSIKYDATDLDRSFDYAKKALNEALKSKKSILISEAYNNLANVYEYRSISDSSLIYHEKALELRKKDGNHTKIGDSYNNIGIAYDKLGDFTKSLDNYFKALRNFEKVNDQEKQAMVLSNIGIVYKTQKEYEKAIEYYKKARRIYQGLNSDFGIAVLDNNISAVLIILKNYNEAIKCAENSKNLYQKNNFERYVVYPIMNIAIANDSLQNYQKAEQLYLQAIDAYKKHQNTYEIANSLNVYASNLLKQKKFKESLNILIEALEYSKISNAVILEVQIRKNLAKVYSEIGDYQKAFNHMGGYSIAMDSLFKQEKTKAVFELEKQYQTEKKEKEILVQRAQLAENQLKIERKNLLISGIIGLAVLTGLIGYQFYRVQRIRNKQLEKENELKDALIKIETQNKLQEQRLRISRDLHDNIGSQLTFIISSIDNLKFLLNKENQEMSERLEDISFFTRNTITELRDTIWAMNKENISFTDLKIRINNFIESARIATKGIEFSFEMDEKIDEEYSFSALEGINIYRVIQESINNSIKHAEPNEIKIKFKKSGERFVICVSDNGIGLDENNIKLGNGIHNMHKRIAELGGELTITNNKGKGTKLKINI